ncbi:hypothetical protein DXU06_27250 [Bradyrhizobium elkanii]|uniref:hypothetical protein n=1 Tax=Bradyrhizobium sp. Mp64 TaxID=3042158 RepID=UPI0009B82856|nr:hypothetical protein [Bradyrhizobium sp. Mp64]MDI2111081.1 hypothetical protein [Bradyrhizobium sp. Mp64]NWL43429.1 hypothetical protein [Bradyrhizobium elkanii]QOZ22121.1 hypothetical protein XI02_39645 [Bradyrhizobium sp. CCBAU 21365]RYM33636.1 hypothetical protein EWH13_01065 [Bradyrhizobium elkanii]
MPEILFSILLGHAVPGISGRYIGELAVLRSVELREAQESISRPVFELLGLKLTRDAKRPRKARAA